MGKTVTTYLIDGNPKDKDGQTLDAVYRKQLE